MERIESSPYDEERPPFGHVFVIAGRWKGRRAYYDDDEGAFCIIYLEGIDGYVRVKPGSIVEAPGPCDTIH